MRTAVFTLAVALRAIYAQPTPPQSFEVASIRLQDGSVRRMVDYSASGPRLTLGAYNIPFLIMEAYDLKNYQVSMSQAPATDFYNIAAVAPGATSPSRDDFRRMLQSLLADRFRLKFHREDREMSVYRLIPDSKGPLLKSASGDDPCAVRVGPVQPQDRNYRYQYTNCTLEPLVNTLQTDRPVLDKTGLTGRYDITFIATPPFKMRESNEPGDIAQEDAIRQLGLKLEGGKASIEVFVVDHVEKPTEN